MSRSKGFTLIELLVVVAIIGILASVVLASLSTARRRGKDAAIKKELTQVRDQAALYYAGANNYGANVASCTTDPQNPGGYPWTSQTAPNIFNTPKSQGGMKEIIDSIAAKLPDPTTMLCVTGPYAVAYYGNPTETWAIYAVLGSGERICLDSTSNFRTYTSSEAHSLWGGKCE